MIRIVTKRARPQPQEKPAQSGRKLMRFDSSSVIQAPLDAPDTKTFDTVKDKDGNVVDYRNVTIKGYLSTFDHITESDRHGDRVKKGAFEQTIPRFLKNPVLLANHYNDVQHIAGRFTVVREDEKGLYVEAVLSDAPSNIDVRFNVAQGNLRTLSMGGIFHYEEDDRTIFRVDLWEGSLTPIPANPDAIFSTRSLTDQERKRVCSA